MPFRSRSELNQEAFPKIASPDSGGVEALDKPEGCFCRLGGGAIQWRQLVHAAAKIAVVVQITDDDGAQAQELRILRGQVKLEEEVVL